MKLTRGEFYYVWERLSKETKKAVDAKCVWEQMSRWAVLNDWNAYIPSELLQHIKAGRGVP